MRFANYEGESREQNLLTLGKLRITYSPARENVGIVMPVSWWLMLIFFGIAAFLIVTYVL